MEQRELEQLINNYPTPMYVFDARVLRERVRFLRDRLPDGVELCYAIKANPFIVKEISDRVDRYELCSPGELRICQELGIPSERFVISGVYKSPEVIAGMTRADSPVGAYTAESVQQLALLQKLSEEKQERLPVLLRLTSGNQFGMAEEEVREAVKNRAAYPFLDFRGIQYFSGTQKQSLKRLRRELEYVQGVMQALREESGFETGELEFGPGFPVTYFQSEEFDEAAFLAEFSELLRSMEQKPRLVLELGRSIAAGCGCYLTRIVDRKSNHDQNYAIVDGGMNHLVYYGQSMAMKLPRCRLYPERDAGEPEKWNICGSLCTVNDILVKQLPMNRPEIGDVLVFENTGAYCMTEGISLFLSRALPAVVLLREDGSPELVREVSETYKMNMPHYEDAAKKGRKENGTAD